MYSTYLQARPKGKLFSVHYILIKVEIYRILVNIHHLQKIFFKFYLILIGAISFSKVDWNRTNGRYLTIGFPHRES